MAKHSKLDTKTAEKVIESLDKAELLSLSEQIKKLAQKAKKVKITSEELAQACRKARREVYKEMYGAT